MGCCSSSFLRVSSRRADPQLSRLWQLQHMKSDASKQSIYQMKLAVQLDQLYQATDFAAERSIVKMTL